MLSKTDLRSETDALLQIRILSKAVEAGFDNPALAILNQLLSVDALALKATSALRKLMPLGSEVMTRILQMAQTPSNSCHVNFVGLRARADKKFATECSHFFSSSSTSENTVIEKWITNRSK